MSVSERTMVSIVAAALLCVSGSSMAASAIEAEREKLNPARVEPVAGTSLSRVILTEKAALRLDIRTATLSQGSGGTVSVPYPALFYETDGSVWVYETDGALSFIRHEVVVDAIDGDQAIIRNGLPAGTKVVTVGVPELYGIEKGVGGE